MISTPRQDKPDNPPQGGLPHHRWFPYRTVGGRCRPGLYYARTEDGRPAGPSDAQVIHTAGRWEAALNDGQTVVYRGDNLRAALRTAESSVAHDQPESRR